MTTPPFEDPRKTLRRYGYAPKKRFSQNFLVARDIVEAIAASVRPAEGETVVELGPGAGTLTAALLRQGAKVVAVERDREMRALLAEEFGSQPLTVIDGDAAALSLEALTTPDGPIPLPVSLCGNLPYAISGAIFRRLVAERTRLRSAVVMTQKEVQRRLAAEPGTKAYGALSVFVSACFDVVPLFDVPPGAFHPAPKVTSAVARLTPRAEARAPVDDPRFIRVVQAAFGMRRKTLHNALKVVEGGRDALTTAQIDRGRRGETLSVEEFGAIAAALSA